MHKKFGKTCNEMKTENIGLELHLREERGYGHLELRVVKLREDGTIGYFDNFTWDGHAMFSSLWITCQYNVDAVRKSYGFMVEYKYAKIASDEVESADMKIKYIKWLNKRIAKWEDKVGISIADGGFGLYVKRVADLMGIRNFVMVKRGSPGASNEYVWVNRDIANVLSDAIATGELNIGW